MKRLAICALYGFAAMTYAAQFYEWVDEKGAKQYTQQPPPSNIKNVQQKQLRANVVETSGPSYSAQQASKNFPVTLYVTATCGEVCKNAQAHLTKRGIPFTEKDPRKPEEIGTFKKLTGGAMEVPVLVVGELRTLKGYLASEWDATLDQAGYPSAAIPGAKPGAAPPAK